MCAVVAGQSTLSQHSLITGEENVKTLQLSATDGAYLATADAMGKHSHLRTCIYV